MFKAIYLDQLNCAHRWLEQGSTGLHFPNREFMMVCMYDRSRSQTVSPRLASPHSSVTWTAAGKGQLSRNCPIAAAAIAGEKGSPNAGWTTRAATGSTSGLLGAVRVLSFASSQPAHCHSWKVKRRSHGWEVSAVFVQLPVQIKWGPRGFVRKAVAAGTLCAT